MDRNTVSGWAVAAVVVAVVAAGALPAAARAQSNGKESFSAIVLPTNEIVAGPGRLLIDVDRWSTQAEETRLMDILRKSGQQAMLNALRDTPSTGSIRTPDSLAYQLRYAEQEPTEEGGRRIMLITDRPIAFQEFSRQARSLEYPFTVIQLELDRNGQGTGTMTYATRIEAYGNVLVLEHLATSPIRLSEVRVER